MEEVELNRRASVVSAIISLKSLKENKRRLKGDYLNIFVLILLYTLQSIPMGLMTTIPMIFSANKVPYALQAIFSFASYPYVMKLLWAPIADSVYSKRFGRRKSWIIPAQYSIAAAMIAMAPFSRELIGDENNSPKIYTLTLLMFLIIILVTCQDVATDGWGLTLLSRRNVQYVASAESVGWTLGALLSTTVYMALESPKFCNQWLRSEPKEYGFVNIEHLFYAIGILYLILTTIICIFKKEANIENEEITLGLIQTFKILFKVVRLKSIFWYIVVQMTANIGIGVFWAATDLKLIQYGVRREILSLLKTPITILNLILPFIIVHKTKYKPMRYYWRFGVVRNVIQIGSLLILYWTQTYNQPKDGDFPWYYYTVLFIYLVIIDVIGFTSRMSLWSFVTSVADPRIGATFMTLFTTIANIGVKWVLTASLALLDPLTIFRNDAIGYKHDETSNNLETTTNFPNFNNTKTPIVNSNNEILIDGFYIQGIFCTIFGVIWFILFKNMIWIMQDWPESEWRIKEPIQAQE